MDSRTFVNDANTYDAEEMCPEIPWPQIRGVGNRLCHEYDRISGPRIWLMVERDLPALKGAVRVALSQVLAQDGQG